MLLYNSIENKEILFNTVFRKDTSFLPNTEYIIITGYVGYSTPKELLNLGFGRIKLIIGMYGNRVKPNLHSILLRVQSENPNIKIFYSNEEIHSKIYIWHVNNSIQEYAIGSANFSSSTALVENLYRETLDLSKNIPDNLQVSILKYVDDIEQFLIPIEEYTVSLDDEERQRHEILAIRGSSLSLLASRSTDQPNILGLTTRVNGVSVASGLNWGYSKGLPLLGDAYISISKEFIVNNLDVIPPKPQDENIPIEVLWDDGETMTMLMEQNGSTIDGILYPKAISTHKNKSLIGTYLRKRIGEKINKDLVFTQEEIDEVRRFKKPNNQVAINQEIFNSINEKLITKEMLDEYGRTTIDIKKLENGSYYFDFGVNHN